MSGFSFFGAMGLRAPSLTGLPVDAGNAKQPGSAAEGSSETQDIDFGAVLLSLLVAVFETPETEAASIEWDGMSASGTVTAGDPDAAADDGPESVSTPVDGVAPDPSTEPHRPATWEATLASLDDQGIAPELVAPLRRIVTRMWQEYGYSVEVVEGYRTPQRQEQLFQQGRTTDGPIVTWTRDSLHSAGQAADLRIDGGWTNVEAFETLQMIAQEEGLTTLGMRDPGHVELPGSGSRNGGAPRDVTAFRTATPNVAAPDVATPNVAAPAQLAAVARVARVASVPQPGSRSPVRRSSSRTGAGGQPSISPLGGVSQDSAAEAPATSGDGMPERAATAVEAPAPTTAHPERAASPRTDLGRSPGREARLVERPDDTTPRPEGQEGSSPGSDPRAPSVTSATGGTHEAGTVGSAIADGATPPTQNVLRPSTPTAGPVSTAEAVQRVQDLQAESETRGAGRVFLDLENADGVGTRLRLTLRGSALDAAIQIDDPDTARVMHSRISELHRALEQRGFDSGAVRIQSQFRPGGEDDAGKRTMYRDRQDPDEGFQKQSGRERQPGKDEK